MRQVTHLELQDENAPKRVAFHPSVVGAASGEDLAFDFTKVANSSRKVLSSAKPGIAAGQNVSHELRGGSIVQKNRSRFEGKATPPVSARAKTYPVKGESFLDELKRVSANSETRQPGKITSRWLKESREAAEAENSEKDEMEKRMAVSPRKFSVNQIAQARTGPPPKSDDFFSELKQWHNDFALRSVEKPSEIKVTTAVKPVPQVEEQVAEEEEKVKEPIIEKDAEQEEQASKKKKKKFWSFSSRSKNKQNSKDEVDNSDDLVEPTEETTAVPQAPLEPEPVQETPLPKKSEIKVEEKPVIPAKDEPVAVEPVETHESKLEPEETAKAPKSKPKKPAEVYNANIMDTPELQEPEDLISDLLQADSWLAETFFKKNKATVEKIAEGPSTEEVEESATESSDETEKKEEETVEEVSRGSLTETNPSLAESAESSIPSQYGVEKEPWFQKISGMFKEPTVTASGDYTTEDEDATEQSVADITNQSTTEYTYQSGTVFTERTEDIEKMVEQQVEEWVGKISSFFNQEAKSGPPISVVELDKYTLDKYEAFAAEKEGDEDSIKADEQSWEPARTMYNRKEVDSFDEELRAEVDQFLRTQCACLAADFDIHPKIGTEKATMKRMEQYLSEKGMSWYEMASGLFQTSTRSGFGSTDDEAQSAESSMGEASGVAPGIARTVVSEATVKHNNKDQNASGIKKKPSYDDILMTLDDGTNVIKMKALMDLYPEESQSLVDSYNNKKSQLKTESSSCSDSKSQKTDSAQKKKSKKTKKSGATLFGSLERKQKNKNKKKRG